MNLLFFELTDLTDIIYISNYIFLILFHLQYLYIIYYNCTIGYIILNILYIDQSIFFFSFIICNK